MHWTLRPDAAQVKEMIRREVESILGSTILRQTAPFKFGSKWSRMHCSLRRSKVVMRWLTTPHSWILVWTGRILLHGCRFKSSTESWNVSECATVSCTYTIYWSSPSVMGWGCCPSSHRHGSDKWVENSCRKAETLKVGNQTQPHLSWPCWPPKRPCKGNVRLSDPEKLAG